MSKTNRRR